MPTYQNRSGRLITIGTTTLSPGEKRPLDYYLCIDDYPDIFKIDDNPLIRNGFFSLFENVSTVTNMSKIYEFRSSLILNVVSSGSFSANAIVEITAFVGITDNIKDFIPIKQFNFKQIQFKDKDGNSSFSWIASDYKLNQQLIDPHHEFVSFAVTNVTNSGTFNVLLKSY